MSEKVFRLCYVSGSWAYFTTQALDKQRGDDWNDVPYEHNAGTPYEWYKSDTIERYEIKRVAYDGPFSEPCSYHGNSPYSVEMINAGDIAWLRTDAYVSPIVNIPAGTEFNKFVELVKLAGGHVYVEAEG